MRLTEAFQQEWSQNRPPVLPFFPVPLPAEDSVWPFLEAVCQNTRLCALGLIFPGRRVLAGAAPSEPGAGNPDEWDVFRFIWQLKRKTGLPLVLAIHYQDLLRFGIIPYGQESHRIGLDALLVRSPDPVELEYLTSEMSAAGTGLAFRLESRDRAAQYNLLKSYTSAFLFLPGRVSPLPPADHPQSSPPLFFTARPAQKAGNNPGPATVRHGWLIEDSLGDGSWRSGREKLDPAPLIRRVLSLQANGRAE